MTIITKKRYFFLKVQNLYIKNLSTFNLLRFSINIKQLALSDIPMESRMLIDQQKPYNKQ
jgi:hypothetical protein